MMSDCWTGTTPMKLQAETGPRIQPREIVNAFTSYVCTSYVAFMHGTTKCGIVSIDAPFQIVPPSPVAEIVAATVRNATILAASVSDEDDRSISRHLNAKRAARIQKPLLKL